METSQSIPQDAIATAPPDTQVFNKEKLVDKNSVAAKLYQIIDDIDTAFDMFKPKMSGFELFVLSRIKHAHRYIESDGYRLYYVAEKNEPVGQQAGKVGE